MLLQKLSVIITAERSKYKLINFWFTNCIALNLNTCDRYVCDPTNMVLVKVQKSTILTTMPSHAHFYYLEKIPGKFLFCMNNQLQ